MMTKEEFIEKTRETMLSLLDTYRAEIDPKAQAIFADAGLCGDSVSYHGVHVLYSDRNENNEYQSHDLLNHSYYSK